MAMTHTGFRRQANNFAEFFPGFERSRRSAGMTTRRRYSSRFFHWRAAKLSHGDDRERLKVEHSNLNFRSRGGIIRAIGRLIIRAT